MNMQQQLEHIQQKLNEMSETISELKNSLKSNTVYSDPGYLYPVIDVNGKKIKVFQYAFDLRDNKVCARFMDDREFEDVTDQLEVGEYVYLVRWPGTNKGAVISPADIHSQTWRVNDLTLDKILIEVMKAHNQWSE